MTIVLFKIWFKVMCINIKLIAITASKYFALHNSLKKWWKCVPFTVEPQLVNASDNKQFG